MVLYLNPLLIYLKRNSYPDLLTNSEKVFEHIISLIADTLDQEQFEQLHQSLGLQSVRI